MKTSRLFPARGPLVRSLIGLAAELPTPARASRIVDRVRLPFVRKASLRRGGDRCAEMARQLEAWG